MASGPPTRGRRKSEDQEIKAVSMNTPEGYKTRQDILGKRARYYYPDSQSQQALGKIRFAVHKAKPLDFKSVKVNETPIEDRLIAIREAAAAVRETGDFRLSEEKEKEANELEQSAKTQADLDARAAATGVSYTLHPTAPIVDMYIPLAMTYNDGVNYENANLNTVGTATLEGINNAQNIFSTAFESLMNGLGSAFSYITDPNIQSEAGRLAALRASRIGSAGFQTAVQIGVQRIMNPNTRSAFRGVNLRQFNFNFKLIANSRREAIAIENIVKHFRRELYPEIEDVDSGIPIAYKYPNAFSISFTHKGKEAKLPRLEYCFLRNVQTNFNPTGAALHDDGRPNEVDLNLSFVEMRTLNKRDVRFGY